MVKRADKEQELLIMPTFHLSQIKVKLQTRYFYYYKTHWLSDYFPTIHAGTVAPNLTKLKTRTLSLTFIQKHFLTCKERNKNSLVYQVCLSRWQSNTVYNSSNIIAWKRVMEERQLKYHLDKISNKLWNAHTE